MSDEKYSRRKTLKTLASASIVGGVAIPEFVRPTRAELSEYEDKWRAKDIADIEDSPRIDGQTSHAASLGHIVTEYSPSRGLYLSDYRLTGAGVSIDGNGNLLKNVNEHSCSCSAVDRYVEDIRPGTEPEKKRDISKERPRRRVR